MDIDEIELNLNNHIPLMGAVNAPTHINDVEEEEAATIRKTMGLVSNLPSLNLIEGSNLDGRVTIGNPVSPTLLKLNEELPSFIEQVQNTQTDPVPFTFPNLAWESVKAGLAQENFFQEKLNRHIDAIENAHKDIALLLDLSAELSKTKEENSELSEKTQQLLEQLKNRGIDLQGETVGDLKRLAGSQESRLRSEIQIKFTTKVQYLMQQIESMHQILKDIIRNDSRLMDHINQAQK